jgi:hypothetical protein
MCKKERYVQSYPVTTESAYVCGKFVLLGNSHVFSPSPPRPKYRTEHTKRAIVTFAVCWRLLVCVSLG